MSESHKYDNDDPFGFGKPSEPKQPEDPNDPFGFNKKADPNEPHDSNVSDWFMDNIEDISPDENVGNDVPPAEAAQPEEDQPVNLLEDEEDKSPDQIRKEFLEGRIPWYLDKQIIVMNRKRGGGMKASREASYVPTSDELKNKFYHEHAQRQPSRAEYRHLSGTMAHLESSLGSALAKLDGMLRSQSTNDRQAFRVRDILKTVDPILEGLTEEGNPDHEALCRMPYGLLFVEKLHTSLLQLSDRAGPQNDIVLASLRFHVEQLHGFAGIVRQSIGWGGTLSPSDVQKAVADYERYNALHYADGSVSITAPEARFLSDGLDIGLRSADGLIGMLEPAIRTLKTRGFAPLDGERFTRFGDNLLSMVHGENDAGARELRDVLNRHGADTSTHIVVTDLLAYPTGGSGEGLYGGAGEGAPRAFWKAYAGLANAISTGQSVDRSLLPALTGLLKATKDFRGILEWNKKYAPALIEQMNQKAASRNTVMGRIGRAASSVGKLFSFPRSAPVKKPAAPRKRPTTEKEISELFARMEERS